MTDNIRHNLSIELYCHMCQNIVGTEDHVKQIRLLNAARDDLSINKKVITITSGSFGEGLELRGSDIDYMYVQKDIEVYVVKPSFIPNISYLSMDSSDVKPGYTQLRLEYSRDQYLLNSSVKFTDTRYLSSTLWKQLFMVNMGGDAIIHGPCLSDKYGLTDIADTIHCKTWIPAAAHWIKRSNNSWPSYNVKQSIIKHGVLLVPIGVKGSPKEDFEWRISFSVGEKFLIHTFSHTQLLCYALLKIVLKDVIDNYSECKELLCSYFLKTILFWISEELPQSAWKPDNFIHCFMQCFMRLIYCVEYSVCLHYFIPDNNMFENKIEGHARKMLLERLHTLQSYGWRCILLSDQVSNFPASTLYFNIEQHLLYMNKVPRTTNSLLLQFANVAFLTQFGTSNGLLISAYRRGIQKTVVCDQSSIKYLYTYYMSMLCSLRGQSIPLNSAYRNNEYQYRQYKSCLSTLLQNIHYDAVSGWLMIASFFYKTKQYTKALRIIMYSVSKCTSEKLHFSMKMVDIHHRLIKMKSLKKRSFVRLWKFILVEIMKFDPTSTLIPDELLLVWNDATALMPSSAYAVFLNFLCHYHLKNVRQYKESFDVLQWVTTHNYLIGDRSLQAAAFNLLGIGFQLLGDMESAKQAFLQSSEIYPS